MNQKNIWIKTCNPGLVLQAILTQPDPMSIIRLWVPAQSVQHYFESNGYAANKIIIESKGEKEPVDNNGTEAGRAANRRAVITIKH